MTRPDPSPVVDALLRMVADAGALAEQVDDPVLASRGVFLVEYLEDMLELKDPAARNTPAGAADS